MFESDLTLAGDEEEVDPICEQLLLFVAVLFFPFVLLYCAARDGLPKGRKQSGAVG